jgi:hypothetical protein
MRLPLILCLSLAATPLAAEDPPGTSLMEEGARLFLRGLMSEAEPMLDEMQRGFREIEPALRDMGPRLTLLVEMMGDVANYEAPERLPNGDILIRRKPGAPPPPALPEANRIAPEGEIEL